MPDKRVEFGVVATHLVPNVRRARRLGRRVVRRLRSGISPRVGVLGETGLSVSGAFRPARQGARGGVARWDFVMYPVPQDASDRHATDEGEQSIPKSWLPVLLAAEAASVPSILVVTRGDDLNHPLAAIASHLVTTDTRLGQVLKEFAGVERTLVLSTSAPPRRLVRQLRSLTTVHTTAAR